MVSKIENNEINNYKSRLKRIRVSRGLTQKELSNLTNINIKSISLYEQHPERINKASIEKLIKITDSLNCTIDDIVEKEYIVY
jgi:transcriptional regulator with XRE-family HTH domain